MKIRAIAFEFEGTPVELADTNIDTLLERLSEWAVHVRSSDIDPDADDAAAEAEAAAEGPDAIPGVPLDGQAAVRAQLDQNAAGDLFEEFLAETSSWPSASVIGIKPRRSPAGAPLDYTRYLRVRKVGSPKGAFAYATPSSGLVEPRLNFGTDAELHAIAPQAWRHDKSHEAYRVNIEIVDRATLEQAIALARLAYDRT